MIEIVSYALKVLGVIFLLIAAVGVVRLPDAFTRMHAATKAGTLGAGLVVAGSALSVAGAEAIGLAVVTLVILLATVPLASHLLARAAYTSGAPFWAGTARDALEGRLSRGDVPGDERADLDILHAPAVPLSITRVVVAPSWGAKGRAARAAQRLSKGTGLPLVVMGLIDNRFVRGGDRVALARDRLEEALSRTLLTEGQSSGDAGVRLHEGVPEDGILREHRDGDLTVLSPVGWFDHGVAPSDEAASERRGTDDGRSGRGDTPLALAQILPRPVLLAADEPNIATITVIDDGSAAIESALGMLAALPPFASARIRVTWVPGEAMPTERRTILSAAAGRTNLGFQAPGGAPSGLREPGDLVVCCRVPGPARGDWYGTDWRERIAPGWRGAVLLV